MKAKPFVKWAGGKTNLLQKIDDNLPAFVKEGNNVTYIEPFLGGGAVLFYMLARYGERLARVIVNDVNEGLINCYRIIQQNPDELISALRKLQADYDACKTREQQGELYYRIRHEFNAHVEIDVNRAAQFIFLNHTCYNGLYRENTSGEFNVPCAYYKHPNIVNEDIIRAAHETLQNVILLCGDYRQVADLIQYGPTFIYFDPPYRPLYETSNNFSQYNKLGFGDREQECLHDFCRKMSARGCYIMQSNSDSRCKDDSSYFENIYQGFIVDKVMATRNINPHATTVRKQSEVLT